MVAAVVEQIPLNEKKLQTKKFVYIVTMSVTVTDQTVILALLRLAVITNLLKKQRR